MFMHCSYTRGSDCCKPKALGGSWSKSKQLWQHSKKRHAAAPGVNILHWCHTALFNVKTLTLNVFSQFFFSTIWASWAATLSFCTSKCFKLSTISQYYWVQSPYVHSIQLMLVNWLKEDSRSCASQFLELKILKLSHISIESSQSSCGSIQGASIQWLQG